MDSIFFYVKLMFISELQISNKDFKALKLEKGHTWHKYIVLKKHWKLFKNLLCKQPLNHSQAIAIAYSKANYCRPV